MRHHFSLSLSCYLRTHRPPTNDGFLFFLKREKNIKVFGTLKKRNGWGENSFTVFFFFFCDDASLAPRFQRVRKLFRVQGYVGRCLALCPCYPVKKRAANAGTHHLGTGSSSSVEFLFFSLNRQTFWEFVDILLRSRETIETKGWNVSFLLLFFPPFCPSEMSKVHSRAGRRERERDEPVTIFEQATVVVLENDVGCQAEHTRPGGDVLYRI